MRYLRAIFWLTVLLGLYQCSGARPVGHIDVPVCWTRVTTGGAVHSSETPECYLPRP